MDPDPEIYPNLDPDPSKQKGPLPLSRLVERVEHPEWSYDGPGQLHGLPPKVEQLRPHHLLLQVLQLPGHRGNVQVPVVAAPGN